MSLAVVDASFAASIAAKRVLRGLAALLENVSRLAIDETRCRSWVARFYLPKAAADLPTPSALAAVQQTQDRGLTTEEFTEAGGANLAIR